MEQKSLDKEAESELRLKMLSLRKPTALQKILNQKIPLPETAVPENGLPNWYKVTLDQRLSFQKMPEGAVIYSRGKVGFNIRDKTKVTSIPESLRFDMSDPYNRYVSYDYDPLHDPHLAGYFNNIRAKNKLRRYGLSTADHDAICTFKMFNDNRKFLYTVNMDAVRYLMDKLDEEARDTLTLRLVDDVAEKVFKKNQLYEKELKRREKFAKAHAGEIAKQLEAAKQKERLAKQREKYLEQFKEQQRMERLAKSLKHQDFIRRRVIAAKEQRLRKIIFMMRSRRKEEARRSERLIRLKAEKEENDRRKVMDEWHARVASQTSALHEEARLLQMYEDQFKEACEARMAKTLNQFLNFQGKMAFRKLQNWKDLHKKKGSFDAMAAELGASFERAQSGSERMSKAQCKALATEVLGEVMCGPSSDYMDHITEARRKMDIRAVTPAPVLYVLKRAVDLSLRQFTRNQLTNKFRLAEHYAVGKSLKIVCGKSYKPAPKKKPIQKAREITSDEAVKKPEVVASSWTILKPEKRLVIGDVTEIDGGPGGEIDENITELRNCRERKPTPMPSETDLIEAVFDQKDEDLFDPLPLRNMPERQKLLDALDKLGKILRKEVLQRVLKGLDIILYEVTLPRIRHDFMWNDVTEKLSQMILDSEDKFNFREITTAADFLARRVLLYLKAYMKKMIQEQKEKQRINKIILQSKAKDVGDGDQPDIIKKSEANVSPQSEIAIVN